MIQPILTKFIQVRISLPRSLVSLQNNSESKSFQVSFRPKANSKSSLSVIGTVSHNLHKMRRNALSPFFSKRSVMEYADSIQLCVDNLCAKLETFHASQSPINLRIAFGALTIDMITLYSYGRSYASLEKSNFDPELYQTMASGGELALLLKQCPWIFKLANLLPYSLAARLDPKVKNVINRKRVMKPQIRIALQDADRVLSIGNRSTNTSNYERQQQKSRSI